MKTTVLISFCNYPHSVSLFNNLPSGAPWKLLCDSPGRKINSISLVSRLTASSPRSLGCSFNTSLLVKAQAQVYQYIFGGILVSLENSKIFVLESIGSTSPISTQLILTPAVTRLCRASLSPLLNATTMTTAMAGRTSQWTQSWWSQRNRRLRILLMKYRASHRSGVVRDSYSQLLSSHRIYQ